MPETRAAPIDQPGTRQDLQPAAEWNATHAEYPRDRCLPQLIEAQAARTPDAIAAVFGAREASYRELNERANRLAHHLRALGVVPDERVAVCLNRGIDMLVAMLAVMKAGAAYLPLDPEYPAERLAFMLDDAGVRVVLTDTSACAALTMAASGDAPAPEPTSAGGRRLIRLDADAAAFATQPASDPVPVATPTNLAYVIYTSGSTGRPKGVMIEHRGLVSNIHWQIREFGFDDRDRFLQRTTIIFDASVWELWTPLCVGATQVIADEMELRDPAATLRLIRAHDISFAFAVPSFFS